MVPSLLIWLLKEKIRALANTSSWQDPRNVLLDQSDPAGLGQLLQARGVQDPAEGPDNFVRRRVTSGGLLTLVWFRSIRTDRGL